MADREEPLGTIWAGTRNPHMLLGICWVHRDRQTRSRELSDLVLSSEGVLLGAERLLLHFQMRHPMRVFEAETRRLLGAVRGSCV